jgi:SAM-dependent methyltransferase
MSFGNILNDTETYYSNKIREHGASAKGVDWNSTESQYLRFTQLLKIVTEDTFSLNDYGCGYGAIIDYLQLQGYRFQYCGFDISPDMLEKARELHGHRDNVSFVHQEIALPVMDYTIASGIFNVKQDVTRSDWHAYTLHTLEQINRVSMRGFAFNALTSYSDHEKQRSDLYYADPRVLFDHCKRSFSRYVSLLHDYPLYEFTILVRK